MILRQNLWALRFNSRHGVGHLALRRAVMFNATLRSREINKQAVCQHSPSTELFPYVYLKRRVSSNPFQTHPRYPTQSTHSLASYTSSVPTCDHNPALLKTTNTLYVSSISSLRQKRNHRRSCSWKKAPSLSRASTSFMYSMALLVRSSKFSFFSSAHHFQSTIPLSLKIKCCVVHMSHIYEWMFLPC